MIVLEVTEEKFGKAMKSVSKIMEHVDCLKEILEAMAEDSNYGDRYGKHYDDDDMYDSRYGNRRGGRRY